MSAEATPSTARPLAVSSEAGHRAPRARRPWQLVLSNPIGALGGVIVVLVILIALFAGLLAPYDPVSQLATPLQPPSGAYPLGTDEFGRDVLSRVIHGARISLYVGVASVGLALVSGSILGLLAGYTAVGWICCSCG